MHREKFLKLEETEGQLLAKVEGLRTKIADLEAKGKDLDQAAYRAEFLEEAGWGAKRSEVERVRGLLEAARAEFDKTKKGVGILAEEIATVRKDIRAEVFADYRPKFAKALKECHGKLKAAVEAARELQGIQDAMNTEAGKYGVSRSPLLPMPAGMPNLVFQVWQREPILEEFERISKSNGYEL